MKNDSKRQIPAKPVKSIKIAAQTRPTLEQAMQLYLTDKLTQGLDPTAYQKHVRELDRRTEFITRRGKFFPHEIGLADLTEFRATWITLYPSSLTRSKVQERLRGFLRYAFNSRMIDHIPALSPIKVTEPTLPLTEAQYEKLLSVIPTEFRYLIDPPAPLGSENVITRPVKHSSPR